MKQRQLKISTFYWAFCMQASLITVLIAGDVQQDLSKYILAGCAVIFFIWGLAFNHNKKLKKAVDYE